MIKGGWIQGLYGSGVSQESFFVFSNMDNTTATTQIPCSIFWGTEKAIMYIHVSTE